MPGCTGLCSIRPCRFGFTHPNLIAASSNCGRVKSQPSTRTVFLLVLFLSVIVLLAWWLFFHREPSYRGVPVRAWVQQLKNTQNSEKNETRSEEHTSELQSRFGISY